jgi:hypothetical protein
LNTSRQWLANAAIKPSLMRRKQTLQAESIEATIKKQFVKNCENTDQLKTKNIGVLSQRNNSMQMKI